MQMLLDADEAGVRLEMVEGLPVWEAHPKLAHVKAARRIEAAIKPLPGSGQECGCIHYPDLYIRFPDGSFKRPDVSIFCSEPMEDEQEIVVTVPEAVVEILSRGYERKDLEIGPPFYLSHGVKDIVVVDPYSDKVVHFGVGFKHDLKSPVELKLQCGCVLAI